MSDRPKAGGTKASPEGGSPITTGKNGSSRQQSEQLNNLLMGIVEREIAEAFLYLRAQLENLFQHLLVGQLLVFRCQRIDRIHQRLNQFEVAFMLGADETGDHLVDHGIDSHHNPSLLFGMSYLFRWRAQRPCVSDAVQQLQELVRACMLKN